MNRTLRIWALPLAALAMLLSVVPAAYAWEPPGGAIFNNPKGNHAAQFKIVNAITRAVQGSPRGSTIMMSAYMFDNGGTYNALVNAHRRGVHVQMVLDTSHARNGRTVRLARKFNRDNTGGAQPQRWGRDQSYVVFCHQACRGKNGYNHTKFYAFSKSGTASNVVMISSSNPNAGGAVKGWNDMYVMKDKPGLWQGITKVMAEMAQDTANDGDRFMQFREGNALARFYPKRTGTHPILEDLNRVRCLGANGGAGVRGRTALHVSMFRWNRKWGMAIARKLVGLAHHGCTLDIIYGAPSRELRLYLTNAAQHSGRISLWDSRYDRNGDGDVDLRVHQKYLLISGHIGNDHSAWQFTAGSQNWGASLRTSDEDTITVTNNRSAYRAYLRNWTLIRNNSADRIGRVVGGRVDFEEVCMFFNRHPEFLETSDTAASQSRLNMRHLAIIEENKDILGGSRVVDIASHDGRWSFAALEAGASHVTGFEGRRELIKHATSTFHAKGVSDEQFQFVQGDVHVKLLRSGVRADVVMCLGFLYHTARYVELFKGIRRTRAEHVIIDTRVLQGVEGPMVEYRTEGTRHQALAVRDRYAMGNRVISSVPSEEAVVLMLNAAGYVVEQRTDWDKLLAEHPNARKIIQYKTGRRVTFRAKRRRRARPVDVSPAPAE